MAEKDRIVLVKKEDLITASVGCVVRVSYQRGNIAVSPWMIFYQKSNDKYSFLEAERAKTLDGLDLVVVHSCPIYGIAFDSVDGARLGPLHEKEFVGPKRDEYGELVSELKKVGLWE